MLARTKDRGGRDRPNIPPKFDCTELMGRAKTHSFSGDHFQRVFNIHAFTWILCLPATSQGTPLQKGKLSDSYSKYAGSDDEGVKRILRMVLDFSKLSPVSK